MKSLDFIDCNIIQDLLPCYIDKISSVTTNKLIEKHLEKCEDCKMALKKMSKNIDNSEILSDQNEEIDYLKGYKKNKIHSILIAIIIFLIIAILSIWILLFSGVVDIQFPLSASDVSVDYMYKTKDNKGNDVLEIHLCSKKYERIEEKSYITIGNNGEKIMIIDVSTKKLKLFNKAPSISTTGIYECIYLEDGIDKICIDSKDMKEIWNKEMEVSSEEEWIKSYLDVKIPLEERELYNYNVHTVNGNWRHFTNGF